MISTRILGIDPGSRKTGFGIIEITDREALYVTSGIIYTSDGAMSHRLGQIFTHVSELIKVYQPTESAIEAVFVHRNAASALKLGQARGAAIAALSVHALEVGEYSPRQVKQSVVGYGNAEKSQVQQMVRHLLQLSDIPAEDAADGLAVALCHYSAQIYFRKGRILG